MSDEKLTWAEAPGELELFAAHKEEAVGSRDERLLQRERPCWQQLPVGRGPRLTPGAWRALTPCAARGCGAATSRCRSWRRAQPPPPPQPRCCRQNRCSGTAPQGLFLFVCSAFEAMS